MQTATPIAFVIASHRRSKFPLHDLANPFPARIVLNELGLGFEERE